MEAGLVVRCEEAMKCLFILHNARFFQGSLAFLSREKSSQCVSQAINQS